MKTAAEIRGRMTLLMQESKGLIEKYPDFMFPDAEASRAQAIGAELADLKGQLDRVKTNRDMVEKLSQYNEYMDTPAANPAFPGKSGDDDGVNAKARDAVEQKAREQRKSVSQLVLTDTEYGAWFKQHAPNGYFAEKVRIASPQVHIPGGLKALVTGTADSSAGAFIEPMRYADQFITRRPLTMRDIITIGQTQSDMVEYVRQVSETNNAAMVPEAQSTAPIGDGTGGTVTAAVGGLKPESGMVFEKVTTNVKTVAHWMPATKRALADAGQMQTLIDGFLRWGLEDELEDQMILGNGSGENFEGLAEHQQPDCTGLRY